MTQAIEKLTRALLLPINPAVVVLLGIYTTLWGVWIANPWWTVFTQAQLYEDMIDAKFVQAAGLVGVSPELFWGSIAIVCGSLITIGALKREYKPLIRGATIAFFHWGIISMMYFMGDWQNTGGITALLMSLYGAFLYVNIRVNFKQNHHIDDVLR